MYSIILEPVINLGPGCKIKLVTVLEPGLLVRVRVKMFIDLTSLALFIITVLSNIIETINKVNSLASMIHSSQGHRQEKFRADRGPKRPSIGLELCWGHKQFCLILMIFNYHHLLSLHQNIIIF